MISGTPPDPDGWGSVVRGPCAPTKVSRPTRLLHIAMAEVRRRLEDTVAAVRSLGNEFTLDLVLVRENEYRPRLERLAAEDGRVRVLPPVPLAATAVHLRHGRGQRFSPSDHPRALTGADRRPVREPRTSASVGPQSCMIG